MLIRVAPEIKALNHLAMVCKGHVNFATCSVVEKDILVVDSF